MRRKHNPYVAIVALLLLAIVLTFALDGCAVVETEATVLKKADRFTVEYAGNECSIITDNETGVQYLAYETAFNNGVGIGLCKLEGGTNDVR
jgi:hypothetical protein